MYLLVTNLSQIYITKHNTIQDLQREISWLERDIRDGTFDPDLTEEFRENFSLTFIEDSRNFSNDCCFSDYPYGTTMVVNLCFDVSLQDEILATSLTTPPKSCSCDFSVVLSQGCQCGGE